MHGTFHANFFFFSVSCFFCPLSNLHVAFSLFLRAGEVNAWIEATVRAAGTSTPKGHCGRLPTWCARSWAKSTRKHVPEATQSHRVDTKRRTSRVDTRGESLTKSVRRNLPETLSSQTEIWRLLLATKFQNEVSVYLARAKPRFTQQRLFKIRNLRNCQRSGTSSG